MEVFLYRWRLIEGLEAQFAVAWTEVTRFYRDKCGSLGSRLHRGDDNIWYAYAQWSSAADRDAAFAAHELSESAARMNAAIKESLPVVRLEVVSDLLIAPNDRKIELANTDP